MINSEKNWEPKHSLVLSSTLHHHQQDSGTGKGFSHSVPLSRRGMYCISLWKSEVSVCVVQSLELIDFLKQKYKIQKSLQSMSVHKLSTPMYLAPGSGSRSPPVPLRLLMALQPSCTPGVTTSLTSDRLVNSVGFHTL